MGLRILHAPLNIAGDPLGLIEGLRAGGHVADLATIADNPFAENGNIDLSFRENGSLSRQYRKYRFCRDEMSRYDVVHFHGGRSILDYGHGAGACTLMDLRWAKRRGQVVAMTFHGSEIRQLGPAACQVSYENRSCATNKVRSRAQKILNICDLIYVTTPDLLEVLPDARLLPQSVSLVDEVTPLVPPSMNGPLRIAHAPSKRSTKGTEDVLRVIESLIEEGYDINFELLENRTHSQALQAMRGTDLFIDQIKIGWYGVAAIEAASYGKPVISSIDSRFVRISRGPQPPFINADKDSLKRRILEAVDNREGLAELGQRCRDYVRKRHSPKENARHVVADYQWVLSLPLINRTAPQPPPWQGTNCEMQPEGPPDRDA